VISTIVTGERAAQFQRETRVAQAKRKAAQARQARKRERKAAQPVAQEPAQAGATLTTEARRAQLLDQWRQGEAQVFAHVAPRYGVSRQTISNDFAALEAEGKVRRNGHGIEVLV
jgi:hypothetical protein